MPKDARLHVCQESPIILLNVEFRGQKNSWFTSRTVSLSMLPSSVRKRVATRRDR